MFSFVPNIAEVLTTELQQIENKACQAELWRSQNRTVSFTQSLSLTPARTTTNHQSEFVHSIHVVPNDYGDHSKENRFQRSYSPGITVAQRCYICNDPFCPNIKVLHETHTVFCPQSDDAGGSSHCEEHVKKSSESGSGSFCDIENPQILSERNGNVLIKEKRNDVMPPNETQQDASPKEQKNLVSNKTPQIPHASFEKEGKFQFGAKRKLVFESLKTFKLPYSSTKKQSPRNADFQPYANSSDCDSSKSQTGNSGFLSECLEKGDASGKNSCGCKGPYHCHTFDSKSTYYYQDNVDVDQKTMAKFASAGKPGRRFDNQISLDRSSQSSQSNLLHYSEKDNHRNICMTFWKPQLSFSPYKYGDKLVEYNSLWPSEQSLKKTMSEVCHDTVLRRAVLDMCKMSLRCGPVRLLKALLALKLVSKLLSTSQILHTPCDYLEF